MPVTAGLPASEHTTHRVERPKGGLQITRLLRLRPTRKLHTHRPSATADVDHLTINAQAEQNIAVLARTEPELVAIPTSRHGHLCRRRREHRAGFGVDR